MVLRTNKKVFDIKNRKENQMTIKDLYVYAQEKGIENCEVEIQYADGGGFYHGTRDLEESEIVVKEETWGTLIIL